MHTMTATASAFLTHEVIADSTAGGSSSVKTKLRFRYFQKSQNNLQFSNRGLSSIGTGDSVRSFSAGSTLGILYG